MSDDYTYFEHMIKDSMKGSKENIPNPPKSHDELNHDEYVKQRIEQDNPGPGAADLVEQKRLVQAYKVHKGKLKPLIKFYTY